MSAPRRLPQQGERITIVWPGGPDPSITMEFDHLDTTMPPPSPGWLWLRGLVVDPPGEMRSRTVYAHRVGDGWEMMPHRP